MVERTSSCGADSSGYAGLTSGFCSSGRKFASGFLQIPHWTDCYVQPVFFGHPCLWLSKGSTSFVRDFHPVVVAHAERTPSPSCALLRHSGRGLATPALREESGRGVPYLYNRYAPKGAVCVYYNGLNQTQGTRCQSRGYEPLLPSIACGWFRNLMCGAAKSQCMRRSRWLPFICVEAL